MNNTFDFNRFGNLLVYDGKKYIRNFGLTLAILCSIPIVGWLLTLIFGFTMPAMPRWLAIAITMGIAAILVPAKAFGYMNLPREGVRFAMLPASNVEKFVSYVLFCLLTPVIIILASWGIDSLLTLLPIGGYRHYISSLNFGEVMKNFILEVGELAEEDITKTEGMDLFMNMFGPGYNWSFIIGIVLNVGLFMLGNLLFKTHKTAKTLAVMIGVSYVVSTIMQLFLLKSGIFPWINGNSMGVSTDLEGLDTLSKFLNDSILISNILNTLLTIGVYIGLFFKLKTQKY